MPADLSHNKVFNRVFRFGAPPAILVYMLISILLGFLWYLILYGRFSLYFTHVNWIYNAGGDVLQHQLGWEWFRYEAWQFPLGKITAYGYPYGTNVTFMDSIPLLSIPLKLFSPWFKPNFQFLGIWELCSIIGQMLAGLLLLREYTRSFALQILGASLLVLSPPMMFRAFYHSSLSAHWIVLFAIWFVIREYRGQLWRGAWAVLFGLAILIHVYFIPMLIPLWLVGLFFRYQRERKHLWLIFDMVIVITVVGLLGLSIGLFDLRVSSLSETGFGIFSWNLNGFFNPFRFSSNFLKEMETGTGGQYEGFSYLGAGSLILLPIASYIFLEKKLWSRRMAFILPIGVAALIYAFIALSNQAYFFSIPLWNIPLSEDFLKFFNMFRTSGRFIWPVYYCLVLFELIVISRNLRFPVAVIILALLLQYSDLQPLYQSKKIAELTDYQTGLQSDLWKEAAETNNHIVVIPARKLRPPYEPIAIYAVRNHLTLNIGYFARSDMGAIEAYGQKKWEDLQANQADPQTIYIITDPNMIAYAKKALSANLFTCEVDDLTVLFSPENELAKAESAHSGYCTSPTALP